MSSDHLPALAEWLWQLDQDTTDPAWSWAEAQAWAIPTGQDLAAILDHQPAHRAVTEATDRLAELHPDAVAVEWAAVPPDWDTTWPPQHPPTLAAVVIRDTSTGPTGTPTWPDQVQAAVEAAGRNDEHAHPLVPLIRWWQHQRAAAPAETRRSGMLPGLDWRTLTVTDREKRLLHIEAQPASGQLSLPIPDRADPYRPWVTDLFDMAGGQAHGRGRGATWPEALFVGAVLHLATDDRTGAPRSLTVPARDLEGWLFPSGEWKDRTRRWERLPQALRDVDQLRIHLPGVGLVRVVSVDSIPHHPRRIRPLPPGNPSWRPTRRPHRLAHPGPLPGRPHRHLPRLPSRHRHPRPTRPPRPRPPQVPTSPNYRPRRAAHPNPPRQTTPRPHPRHRTEPSRSRPAHIHPS